MEEKVMLHQPIRMYHELASWWHLLSPPEDYAEEAEIYRAAIAQNSSIETKTLLELGSGGGNNASHLKTFFKVTLVDLSEQMLAVSRKINPGIEHLHGDMRCLRLNREFDAVFIQDAIAYMTTAKDLRQAIDTAYIHCRPGGVSLFAPDYTKENFFPSTYHDGTDGDNRSMRYLEWVHDPDSEDNTFLVDYAFLLKTGDDVRCEHERQACGLFCQAEWMHHISEAGFEPMMLPFRHSESVTENDVMFVGRKPSVP